MTIPSTHDGVGILALQAMLSNCKVIAAAGTAMDAYLEPSSHCKLDVQSLTEMLKDELDNIAEIRESQDANYFRALVDKSQFTARSMATSYISTWQNML